MKCDKCKKDTFIIFINRNHEKFCSNCWDKIPKKNEWEEIEERNKKYK